MAAAGLERQITTLLTEMNARAGFVNALVCTDDGLLVADAGSAAQPDELAGFTSLFDDIVRRAERDLGARRIEEVTLLDPGSGRWVFRRLPVTGPRRFFLVVRLPTRASWRRALGDASGRIAELLGDLAAEVP